MKLEVKESNIRIDKYLSENTEYSRSLIQKMIEDNYITVNGNNIKQNHKLEENDIIEIKDGYTIDNNILPETIKLDIVYEDDYLMIINKPSGMVVHPGSGNYEHTLVNALMGYTKELSDNNGEIRPGIVHRIDKDTSGLIIVAKTNKCHELLSEGFKNKTIKREYIALVHGEIKTETATIDAPIGRQPNDRKKMCVTDINSKKAVTHLTVLKRYKGFTLVKLQLETGRTHQIRVHMKYINHPVFNDQVYSNGKCTEFGQFLHSESIDFIHPITKQHIHYECDLPKYFKDYLDTLTSL